MFVRQLIFGLSGLRLEELKLVGRSAEIGGGRKTAAGSCFGRWEQGGCRCEEKSGHEFPAEPSAEHFASIGFWHEPLCGQVQR